MAMERRDRKVQRRSAPAQFRAAEEAGGDKYIEGYFAVYDSPYVQFDGGVETIARGAFDNIDGQDIRALVNHDTTLVIGRTKAGTLTLQDKEKGLYGRVMINQMDQDALNIYARVQRGDVSQASFGFWIEEEDVETMDDGTVHWTIRKVKLDEVSVVTFPAYEETALEARRRDLEHIRAREEDAWRMRMKARVKKWH